MKRNAQLLLLISFLLYVLTGCAFQSTLYSNDDVIKLKAEALSYKDMLRFFKDHDGVTYDEVCGMILDGRTELSDLAPQEIHNLAMIGYLELGMQPDDVDGKNLPPEPFPHETAVPTAAPKPTEPPKPMNTPEMNQETAAPTPIVPSEGQDGADSSEENDTLSAFSGIPNEVENRISVIKTSAKDYLRGQKKDYDSDNTCDDNLDTSWQIKSYDGRGQWLTYDFGDTMCIEKICFWLGNWNEDKYFNDDRPTTLKVSFFQGDGEVGVPREINISPDDRTAYCYVLGTPVAASSVMIELIDITAVGKETCISEIVFSGEEAIS